MEVALRSESGADEEGGHKEEIAIMSKVDDELESARAEMGEVRVENQRLKMYLDRITNEYATLQMRFQNITKNNYDQEVLKESELVSLSLGRNPSYQNKDEPITREINRQRKNEETEQDLLSLGLECKFETSSKSGGSTTHEPLPNSSLTNSSEVQKREVVGETAGAPKALKTMRNTADDEVSRQEHPLKKVRVSVRARIDTPTMNDGCQWRKYGQKIAKGNPCPRAYYRCTIAPLCPVRKQVQRCVEEMSILITTYEGTHNHPLPISATAMASTTSAAASMLLSGSSSSQSGPLNIPSPASTDLHGLNLYLSDITSKSKQFYLPTNSSISSLTSIPTVTLDLTSTPSSSSSSYFNRFSTSNYPNPPRFSPSTSTLNFSSSESNAMSWTNNFLQPYKTISLGSQQPSYMPKNNPFSTTPSQHNSLPADTIAAATKAITADPSFQSALAAALTSIIGTQENQTSYADHNLSQKMNWGDLFPTMSSALLPSSPAKVNGCSSSFFNTKPATNGVQPGNFLPPSLPFSSSNSASAPPCDNEDNNN
ncbi:WRKY family transcription factor [Quillaja saponaria]|uniref:WRKY family transcription factor n=1 Tax=Quillaja saponaria TaxID=32244 RepID=A0AAD7PI15_QUISA|nr:WRKY family transcription factor [Quillaja saponaria]